MLRYAVCKLDKLRFVELFSRLIRIIIYQIHGQSADGGFIGLFISAEKCIKPFSESFHNVNFLRFSLFCIICLIADYSLSHSISSSARLI